MMAKASQRRPPAKKHSNRETSESDLAALGVRDVFLRRFRSLRYAHARKLYDYYLTWHTLLDSGVLATPEDYGGSIGDRRADFYAHLDTWYQTFPEFFDGFVRALYGLRSDNEWVSREATKILPLLKEEHRRWVAIACVSHEETQSWRAPQWLCRHTETTETVLAALDARTHECLAEALRAALGEMRMQSALGKSVAGQISQPAEISQGGSATNASAETLFRPSPDYAAATFKGESYRFPPTAARIIQYLHEAYLGGHPERSQGAILEAVGASSTSQVRDAFKRNPAWGKLVISHRKGRYQLGLPDPPPSRRP